MTTAVAAHYRSGLMQARWEVTLRLGQGKLKHVVRAADADAAGAKAMRAHPDAAVFSTKQLGGAP